MIMQNLGSMVSLEEWAFDGTGRDQMKTDSSVVSAKGQMCELMIVSASSRCEVAAGL